MKEMEENEAFFTGIITGINLYQNKIVTAHERKLPIRIGDKTYYVQSSRERLQEAIDKICR